MMRLLYTGFLVLVFNLPVFAVADTGNPGYTSSGSLMLAENQSDENEPEPGSLVIPGEDKDQKDKKCLNVCKEWGESCMINPRTGASNCRRTCKQFGMECF